jgi:hypothetical protein
MKLTVVINEAKRSQPTFGDLKCGDLYWVGTDSGRPDALWLKLQPTSARTNCVRLHDGTCGVTLSHLPVTPLPPDAAIHFHEETA